MISTPAHNGPVTAMELSESTKSRFAREVAKYPAEQAQSAVMACLSIVQQENGYDKLDQLIDGLKAAEGKQ